MNQQDPIIEYDPLYLLSERYRELTSVPEEQRDNEEISRIEKILQREAPYFLYAEGDTFITV